MPRVEVQLLALAYLAAMCLIFNLIAIPVFADQVFERTGSLAGIEIVMLGGFLVVFALDLVSILSGPPPVQVPASLTPSNVAWRAFAILCLVLLLAAKVMVDEIAREGPHGWSTHGEWLILYVVLGLQLSYVLAHPAGRIEFSGRRRRTPACFTMAGSFSTSSCSR